MKKALTLTMILVASDGFNAPLAVLDRRLWAAPGNTIVGE